MYGCTSASDDSRAWEGDGRAQALVDLGLTMPLVVCTYLSRNYSVKTKSEGKAFLRVQLTHENIQYNKKCN